MSSLSSVADPIGAEGARYSERYIGVDEGVELRVLEWTPELPSGEEQIFFIAGWISLVDGWAELLRAVTPHRRVVYLETREKHTARIADHRLAVQEFSISRLAEDLIVAAERLGLDLDKTLMLGSSLGANAILEAFKSGRLAARGAFLVNPNSRFVFPWWAPAVIHLPRSVYSIARGVVVAYLRRQRVDASKDPSQMQRYERTLTAADPIRLKLSARAVQGYEVWPNLETIRAPVALAYAESDTLHGEREIRAIADLLPRGYPVQCRSNSAMHGAELVPELDRFLEMIGCSEDAEAL